MKTKCEILTAIKKAERISAVNSMGCNESWYDCYYAIGQTFTEEELETMSEEELNHLVKLADKISEALY